MHSGNVCRIRLARREAIGSERRPTVVRITVELVEVTRQGRREGTRCRSDLIPLCPHSKMSPTSTLRGLGLGETPLRRWEAVTEMGRSKALIGSIATPSQRRTIDRGTTPRLTSVGYTDRCREVSQSRALCIKYPTDQPTFLAAYSCLLIYPPKKCVKEGTDRPDQSAGGGVRDFCG
jgi:hypothetical protein